MSLPSYPEYKDSELEWLPSVPSHWDVCALKRVASLKSGDSITSEQITEVGEFPVYGGNGLRGFTSYFTHEGRFALIGRQGALCGNVNYSQGQFWASEHAVVATPIKPAETTWLGELMRAMNLNQYSVSAAQPGLSVELISNIGVPYPPLSEQTAIATFLDRETGKIDALIAEQEKLLALLAEKRQVTISHAVTKGLHPDAPMKDSGVVWLGEVPEHWDVCLLKRAFATTDYGISEQLSTEGLVAVLRMGNISNGQVLLDDLKYVEQVEPNLLLQPGDLLFNRTNSLDLIGKVGIFVQKMETPISFASYLVRLRLVNECAPEFFAYLLNTHGVLGDARARAFISIGQCNLNPSRYGEIVIGIPPLAEQTAIATFLDVETAKLDALKAESEGAIALLKERRSALIAAAVTGQIDLRETVQC